MRRRFAAVIVPVCLLSALTSCTTANAGSKSTLELGPIQAHFVQSEFLTSYRAWVRDGSIAGPLKLTITWTLRLELVDKAGAPDPETPGSGAGVDIGCTNHGDLKNTQHVTESQPSAQRYASESFFLWHHPDPQNSFPPKWYHCDHQLQGPHGHQGLITLEVSDGIWKCVATYKGTHSSIPAKAGSPNPNVRNGTASEPTCSKIKVSSP